MLISVLDVGDGGCTILRTHCQTHMDEMVVIDCGSNSVKSSTAMNRLLGEIDFFPENITSIVVTHFDTDHYLGFIQLAKWMKKNHRTFKQLKVYAPRPPETETKYMMSLLAFESVRTGIRNVDFAVALSQVTDPGQFEFIPLHRDSLNFILWHQNYEVYWPPLQLPQDVALDVDRAIILFNELSENLKNAGYPELERAMEIARNGILSNTLDSEQESRRDNFLNFSIEARLEEDQDQVEADFLQQIESTKIPQEFKNDFKKVWDSFRRANNNMSLVFDDNYLRNIVAFGDVGFKVLDWLGSRGELNKKYRVMLSPHHGTQPWPQSLKTSAILCLSQNGRKRNHLFYRHFQTHLNNKDCRSTYKLSHHIFAPETVCLY